MSDGVRLDVSSIQRFHSLEGLRGYMAWWVVCGHAIQISGTADSFPHRISALLLHGSAAVNIFIILSGFVVTHLILGRQEPYRVYLLRRGLRIIPVYFFCLVLAVLTRSAFDFAYSLPWASSRGWADGSLAAATDHPTTHLLLHLSLLHGVFPDSFLPYASSTLLGPAWSISLEWQFYMLAPLIAALLCTSLPIRMAVTGLLLYVVFVFKSGAFGVWQFPSMLLLSLHFFLLGMWCRIYLASLARPPWWVLPVLGGVGGFLWPEAQLELLIWSLFLAATILEGSRPDTRDPAARLILSVSTNRLITRLGKASYSTYLVHMPFWSIVIWSGNKLLQLHSQGATIILVLLSLIALVPVSLLLYRYIERPCIRSGERFGRTGNLDFPPPEMSPLLPTDIE